MLAAGLWGRELAAKAGVTVPLQAAEHYYLLTEPIAGVTPESVPVIEDGEAYGYYREEGGGLLVGMFEPVAKAWALDGTPRDSAFAVLPPDWDRMAPFLEVAMRRFPALEDAGIRTLFCGPESFTDDLSPMLGESPEVDDLYLACGLNSVGILSGGGLGHMMAQWLIEEHPPLDVTAVGVDRAHEFQATRLFREERTVERLGFLLNDLSWPNAQNRLGRNVRRSPYHPQHVADGAHFVATSGWEYPDYFAGPGVTPTVEWGFARGEAFERTREEHLHARENLAIFDLSLMSHHLVQGPDAMAVLNRVCANDVDTAVGRVVYTQWLDDRGGIIADVTVTRLAEDTYMVVSGDNIHRRVPAWIRRQTRDGEFVTVTDVTGGHSLLSVQGPKSRELLQRLSPDDWSDAAFPYLTAQKVELGYTPLWALRVTYVGELGWDLLVPTEFGATLYDQLREAGADLGFRPTGVGALETMRLEKAFRDMGHDIDSTDTPLEAGLGFAVAWDKPGGFVGRDALLKQRESGPLTQSAGQRAAHLARLRPVRRRAGLLGRQAGRPRPQRRLRPLPRRRVRDRRRHPRRGHHRRRPGRRLVRDRRRRHPGAGPGVAEAVLRPGAVAHPLLNAGARQPVLTQRKTHPLTTFQARSHADERAQGPCLMHEVRPTVGVADRVPERLGHGNRDRARKDCSHVRVLGRLHQNDRDLDDPPPVGRHGHHPVRGLRCRCSRGPRSGATHAGARTVPGL